MITAILMVTLSVVTYVAYGGRVGIIIFDSLPTEMYAMVLRLLYSLAMVFTVPMTMWPGLMTLEKYIVPEKGQMAEACCSQCHSNAIANIDRRLGLVLLQQPGHSGLYRWLALLLSFTFVCCFISSSF